MELFRHQVSILSAKWIPASKTCSSQRTLICSTNFGSDTPQKVGTRNTLALSAGGLPSLGRRNFLNHRAIVSLLWSLYFLLHAPRGAAKRHAMCAVHDRDVEVGARKPTQRVDRKPRRAEGL